MTLDEFKAWLEGFEHSFPYISRGGMVPEIDGVLQRGAPNDEQWRAIKEKLALVGAKPLFIPQMATVPNQDLIRKYYDACSQSQGTLSNGAGGYAS